jgi:hypothetical protein
MQAAVETVTVWVKTQRFHMLLLVLVAFITLAPMYSRQAAGSIIPETLISLVLLAAIGCLRFRKRGIVTTRWFGAFTLVSGWIPVFFPSPVTTTAVAVFRIGFFLIVTVALIYQVAVSKKVHLPLIVGAIDGYLLLGIVGGVAFAVLDVLFPGSISHPTGVPARPDYVYFAFITMLTIGYGDVLPLSIPARTIAIFLAVGGQMYIAILVAIIVGKYIAASQVEQAGS